MALEHPRQANELRNSYMSLPAGASAYAILTGVVAFRSNNWLHGSNIAGVSPIEFGKGIY